MFYHESISEKLLGKFLWKVFMKVFPESFSGKFFRSFKLENLRRKIFWQVFFESVRGIFFSPEMCPNIFFEKILQENNFCLFLVIFRFLGYF